MHVRLIRKFSERIDDVDLSTCHVGDILDLPDRDAHLLIAEGWASPVREKSRGSVHQPTEAADARRRWRRVMSEINEQSPGTQTILIVDPDGASQQATVESFKGAGWRTIAADGFESAGSLLESARPDLLITTVRLGLFNGLYLCIRGRRRNPRMAAIVIDNSWDAVLERESKKVGVTAYLAKPVDPDELLRRAGEALAGRERRRWSRMTVAADVPIRTAAVRTTARLLDVSYGGFRVESGSAPLPDLFFTLELPAVGLWVKARSVWTRRTEPAGPWSIGAAVAAPIESEKTRWHQWVFTVREGSGSQPR